MAFEPYTRVDFGPAKVGLKTVGYTLVKAGRPIGPRVVRGIEDLGGGHYGAAVSYPSHFRGQLVWDTGGPSPQTVAFEVTPEQGAVRVGTAADVKRAAPRPRRARPGVIPASPAGPAYSPYDSMPAPPSRALIGCQAPPATPSPVNGSCPQTVTVSSAPCPSVCWTMQDECGPIDLSDCAVGDPPQVLGTLRVAPDCLNYCVDFPADSPDPVSGAMCAEIDPQQMGGPGIYVAEMAIFDPSGECMAATNKFYLVVEQSLFGGQCGQRAGPPSMAELRLELRDCSPTENSLYQDSLAFSDSEIIACMRTPVDYWNEALPPCPPGFTTQNFPFRYQWKQAVKAQLYRIAAEYHRRSQVNYSAGGVTFDQHSNKAQLYDQIASELWGDFKQWVQSRKIAFNLEQAWSELPSDYSRYSYGGYHY
jgi:hypothetical protein